VLFLGASAFAAATHGRLGRIARHLRHVLHLH
jgi:hypothetical protein